MTLLWRYNDVICQLNYTKLFSLWFSTTLPNFISIPLTVLELWVFPTARAQTPKKIPGRIGLSLRYQSSDITIEISAMSLSLIKTGLRGASKAYS